jgi:hypothetical protein
MHIFQLLGSGFANRQIATLLGLSVKTVDSHQENIKHKLHLRSCAELRERAAKWVEQTFDAEEHAFSGAGQQRKQKLPAPSASVIEELAAMGAAGTAAFVSKPFPTPPPPYAQ